MEKHAQCQTMGRITSKKKKRNPVRAALNPHQRRRVEETSLGPRLATDPTGSHYPETAGADQGFFVHRTTIVLISA